MSLKTKDDVSNAEHKLNALEAQAIEKLTRIKESAKKAGATYHLRAIIELGDSSIEIGMRGQPGHMGD